jgi:hypothetical protein
MLGLSRRAVHGPVARSMQPDTYEGQDGSGDDPRYEHYQVVIGHVRFPGRRCANSQMAANADQVKRSW